MSEVRVGVEEFGPVAPFYDELMHSVPYRMWVGYYLLLLSTMGVKPKSMLDVCCGTGSMAELLQQEGFEVEGFDLSPAMIRQAREKSRLSLNPIRYEVLDAAEFDMGRKYDAAYSFFDSLNYIVEPDRLQAALCRIAAHLPTGGSFVFDLNTAYAFEQDMFTQRKLQNHSKVRYDWKGEWNPLTRICTVEMVFWIGGEERRERHVQRAYSDSEIRSALAAAGFGEVQCYHSYTLDKPRVKSDRVHYTCLRTEL